MTVTVGFGELGGDCVGLLAGSVGWDFVGEGEGLSVGEGDVRTGDLMGLELVEAAAADLEVGLVLIAQADVQTVAPLHFRSDSEGQQPPISCQRKFVIDSCFSLEIGRDGKDEPSKDTDPASHPVELAEVGLDGDSDTGLTGVGVTMSEVIGVVDGPTTMTAEESMTVVSTIAEVATVGAATVGAMTLVAVAVSARLNRSPKAAWTRGGA
jgi:hypothetical protein